MGGGQHLEEANVEQLIFQNLENSNIEVRKVELFGFSFFWI